MRLFFLDWKRVAADLLLMIVVLSPIVLSALSDSVLQLTRSLALPFILYPCEYEYEYEYTLTLEVLNILFHYYYRPRYE